MEQSTEPSTTVPQSEAVNPVFKIIRQPCSSERPTEGVLLFDDHRLFTLEQPWRDNEPNVSCVPEGRYPCVIAWSNRYKRLMPRLLTVPGRQGILIHPGNFVDQTEGCILLGTLAYNGAVYNSQQAFIRFFDWLSTALKEAVVWCEITTQPDWSAT